MLDSAQIKKLLFIDGIVTELFYCESHDDRVYLEPERVLRELRTRDEVECS